MGRGCYLKSTRHACTRVAQSNIVNKGNEESASSHAKDASYRPGALAALKLSTELKLPLSPIEGEEAPSASGWLGRED